MENRTNHIAPIVDEPVDLWSLRGADFFSSSRVSDKQWASIKEGIPQDEEHEYNKTIWYFKTSQKLRAKVYQFIHNRNSIQVNLGRIIELHLKDLKLSAAFHDLRDVQELLPWECNFLTNCIVLGGPVAAFSAVHYKADYLSVGYVQDYLTEWVPLEKIKVETSDPYQKFAPSHLLIELVKSHMIKPSLDILQLMKELKRIQTINADEEKNIESLLTEQVESLFTHLAKRMFITQETIQISSDNRFTVEVCRDLIHRLSLDPYNPRPVLDILYNEIIDFVSQTTSLKRSWGKIIIDEKLEIKLILKEDAFIFPDIDEIAEDKWLIM